MSLQINTPLTSNQGFAVPTGSYCFISAELGNNLRYEAKVTCLFFKDKASFDTKRLRFNPIELPDDKQCFIYPLSVNAFANITMLQIHNFVKTSFEQTLGAGTVAIVE